MVTAVVVDAERDAGHQLYSWMPLACERLRKPTPMPEDSCTLPFRLLMWEERGFFYEHAPKHALQQDAFASC